MKLVKAQRTSGLPSSNSSASLSSKSTTTQSYVSSPNARIASSSTTHLDSPACATPKTPSKARSRYPPTSFSLTRAFSFGGKKHSVKGKMKLEPINPALSSTLGDEESPAATLLLQPVITPSEPRHDIHSPISPLPPPVSSSPISLGVETPTRPLCSDSTLHDTLLIHARPSVPPLQITPPCPASSAAIKATPTPSPSSSGSRAHTPGSPTEAKGHRTTPQKPAGPRPMSAVITPTPASKRSTPNGSHQSRSPSDVAQRRASYDAPAFLTILTPPPLSPSSLSDDDVASPLNTMSSLERNSSSSTTASSAFGPSMTEESSILKTPHDIIHSSPSHRHASLGQVFSALDPDNAFGRPGLSRSSTWSYKSGDDIQIPQAPTRPSDEKEVETSQHWTVLSQSSTPLPDLASVESRAHSPTPHNSDSSLSASSTASMSSPRPPKLRRNLSTGAPVEPLVSTHIVQTRITATEHRRSVTFEEMAPNDYFRPRVIPPEIRARSTSLSGMSHSASMYSVGEVEYARGGVMSTAQTVAILDTQTVQSPPAIEEDLEGPSLEVTETIERFKTSSTAMSRAFELDKPVTRVPRLSLSLRPPPLPPHLVDPAAPGGGLPEPTREPLRQRHSSTPPLVHASQPTSPQRTTPLSQLWRRLSTGGKSKTSKEKAKARATTDGPPQPKGNMLVEESTTAVPPVPAVSPIPAPSMPLGVKQLIKKASLKRLRSPKKAEPIPLPIEEKENTPPQSVLESRSSPEPSPVKQEENAASSEPSQKRRRTPSALLLSHRSTSLVQLPAAASPLEDDVVSPPLDSLMRDLLSSDELNAQLTRAMTFGSPSDLLSPSAPISEADREKRKKYRQTLVAIKDDTIFHQVLQNLSQLQTRSSPRPGSRQRSRSPLQRRNSAGEDDDRLEIRPTRSSMKSPSRTISNRKARESQIRAWFVTREIVQGERRHGRLLARGVQTVQAVADTLSMEMHASSTRMTRSKSITGMARSPSRVRRRNVSISDPTGLQALDSNVSSSASSATATPLDILLERLPKLLAVSLTLSTAFGNDPSPYGVAVAFGNMEKELCEEIGMWAGEVGTLVAMGLGDIIDQTPANSRKGSLVELGMTGMEDDPDERLGFADILMTPITRALRYRLLFKELLDTMPTTSSSRPAVEAALRSAQLLGAECDRRQELDLEELRRTSRRASGPTVSFGAAAESSRGRQKKKRPKSMVGMSSVRNSVAWAIEA